MKIVVCVSTLTIGGAERVAALWVNGFHRQGHEVHVVLFNERAPRTYPIPEEVKVHSCDTRKGNNRYVNFIRRKLLQRRRLHKIFKEVAPDVVIVVMLPLGPLVLKAKGGLPFKIIETDHDAYERPRSVPMSERTTYLKFDFNKRYDRVTVLTRADFDFIGDRLNNVSVLPNPLAFAPVKIIPPKDKVILAMGRLEDWHCKGFDILIKSWAKIATQYPDWKLKIVGGGKEESKNVLLSLVRAYHLESQFELLPFQENPLPLYQQAAIFCLSSRYEGFGMVLIEAMSQGCACIACDYKGRQAEIIPDSKYGILCAVDDVDALAQSLDRVISDDTLRTALQKAAPERAADYELGHIMERWEAIFKETGVKEKKSLM